MEQQPAFAWLPLRSYGLPVLKELYKLYNRKVHVHEVKVVGAGWWASEVEYSCSVGLAAGRALGFGSGFRVSACLSGCVKHLASSVGFWWNLQKSACAASFGAGKLHTCPAQSIAEVSVHHSSRLGRALISRSHPGREPA